MGRSPERDREIDAICQMIRNASLAGIPALKYNLTILGVVRSEPTFPDDGDVDMIRAMRGYKEVGYDGMIMPDHVPHIEGDERQQQAFAFAFGFIQALIQLVSSEG